MIKPGYIEITDNMPNTNKCYICGCINNAIPSDLYSMWYNGKQRIICSITCRQKILDLCKIHPEKTYSQK